MVVDDPTHIEGEADAVNSEPITVEPTKTSKNAERKRRKYTEVNDPDMARIGPTVDSSAKPGTKPGTGKETPVETPLRSILDQPVEPSISAIVGAILTEYIHSHSEIPEGIVAESFRTKTVVRIEGKIQIVDMSVPDAMSRYVGFVGGEAANQIESFIVKYPNTACIVAGVGTLTFFQLQFQRMLEKLRNEQA